MTSPKIFTVRHSLLFTKMRVYRSGGVRSLEAQQRTYLGSRFVDLLSYELLLDAKSASSNEIRLAILHRIFKFHVRAGR